MQIFMSLTSFLRHATPPPLTLDSLLRTRRHVAPTPFLLTTANNNNDTDNSRSCAVGCSVRSSRHHPTRIPSLQGATPRPPEEATPTPATGKAPRLPRGVGAGRPEHRFVPLRPDRRRRAVPAAALSPPHFGSRGPSSATPPVPAHLQLAAAASLLSVVAAIGWRPQRDR